MINISDTIINIGVNDHKIKLFESQFPVPQGMAYNSYVILDDKIAVTDTVEESFGEQWFHNLRETLAGRSPDYLIIHHMEGDHSANIKAFLEKYPAAQLVTSAVALNIIKCYFNVDYSDRAIIVKEGDVLELGRHSLKFIAAPMVHWPEVMMSYETSENILFSADAFGTFGANDVSNEDCWDNEARRYYYGIVGKFGQNVQSVLKKVAPLDIETICSLHGPALTGDLEHVLYLYDTWSSYRPESDGVFIPYTSVYGHNEKVVMAFVKELKDAGIEVVAMNLAENDLSEAMALCYYYKNIIFSTTTYNTGIFPLMNDLISRLEDHNFCNRTVGFIENGSWAPAAARVMKEKLSKCSNIDFIEGGKVTVKGSLNEDGIKALKDLVSKINK